VPVLVDAVVQALAIARGETLVDGTFGAGGYTRAMLAAGAGRVIGFDRDPDAIAQGPSLVPDAISTGHLTLIEDRFSQMDRVLAERGIAAGERLLEVLKLMRQAEDPSPQAAHQLREGVDLAVMLADRLQGAANK